MKPEELVGRRVRIWFDVATRGEIRKGRAKDRYIEGVVERHPLFSFVVPAPDGRLPYVVDETRVLDLWVCSTTPFDPKPDGTWVPVFDGRPRKK